MFSRLRSVSWGFCVLALVACTGTPSEPAREQARRAPSDKPSAPVELSLATQALGGGDYRVTLTAHPTRDVPALALVLDGRSEQLGAVRAGETRRLTARVHLAEGDGRDVVAGAATGTGNHRRSRAAVARVGAPAVAQKSLPVRVITLSDGTQIAEVRP